MTNVEKTANAVKLHIGKQLTAKEIVALTVNAYPDVVPASIMPSDYVVGSKYSNLQLFTKTGNTYTVVQPVVIPRRASNRGVSLQDALASAMAKLAPAAQATGIVEQPETTDENHEGEELEPDAVNTDN